MIRFCFIIVLLLTFATALFFRLGGLNAQTSDSLVALAQKVAAQKDTADPSEQIVFEISEAEKERLKEVDNANAPYLAALYAQMRPRAAARILAEIENQKAVLILAHMSTSSVAGILAAFPPDQAAILASDLADYKAASGQR